MKNDFDFDKIDARIGYDTPEGFFETLTQKTMNNIKASEQRRLHRRTILRRSITSAVAVAASALVAILLFADFKTNSSVDIAANMSFEDSIDSVLAAMSDSEINELSVIVDNDVFYMDDTF